MPELRVVPLINPVVAAYGTIFWPVLFVLGSNSHPKNGGYVIQHVIGRIGPLSKNYWEAFRVQPGQTMPPAEHLDWKKSKGAWVTHADFKVRLSKVYADHLVDKWLAMDANDFFWSNTHLNPGKAGANISWDGEAFYVDNVADLPSYWDPRNEPGAGGLPAAQDAASGDIIRKWLKDKKATSGVKHSLDVFVASGGATKVLSHVP